MIRFAQSLLLAAGDAATPSAPAGGAQTPGSLISSPLMLVVPFILIWYFLILRPQGAEKKRRAAILAAIKKNDKVCTIGGIIGTVVNVKDDEITLKVDESSNTKITFRRGAIERVLTAGEKPAPAENGGSNAAAKK